jgi:hypothetical protein
VSPDLRTEQPLQQDCETRAMPVGAENPVTSCDVHVLVHEAAVISR